jgi:hypothetical protein
MSDNFVDSCKFTAFILIERLRESDKKESNEKKLVTIITFNIQIYLEKFYFH